MAHDGERELERVRAVEQRLERAEELPEPARDTAIGLVEALLALYGEGLVRIVGAGARLGGDAFTAELAADELVSHLLLLHGLHPQAVPERIGLAIERLEPRLNGARADLVEVGAGAARLRVSGTSGCGSSRAAVNAALDEAVRAAAPEVTRVEVEHVARPATVIPAEHLLQRIARPPVHPDPGPA
ncbi:hypothetical protein GCM10023322_62520 [Rugosimonospora acidiphila]|uniref:NIF system FeS cluster assembly NifU C-terminal domain-containing protein n=1 Tax=Rugosimonospora acidiphila TaxID=556531 RepID=A0ABP9SID9_9ACTN